VRVGTRRWEWWRGEVEVTSRRQKRRKIDAT
jgi:hypothetical protein